MTLVLKITRTQTEGYQYLNTITETPRRLYIIHSNTSPPYRIKRISFNFKTLYKIPQSEKQEIKPKNIEVNHLCLIET